MADIDWLDWPALGNVKACTTLRESGFSKAPYDTFNLAQHVGDDSQLVDKNRAILMDRITQNTICWLNQVHSNIVVNVADHQNHLLKADASFSRQADQVCCVMTADCLPVFFCNEKGTQVAIAHAGWRGLCDGILQNTLKTFADPHSVIAFLGPAISQAVFEVGDDVRDAFLAQENDIGPLAQHFVVGDVEGKWMADIYGLARSILSCHSVSNIYGGGCCTFLESDHYFSYRRDGITGRMAHLIWMES